MKLDINEVYLAKIAIETISVKGGDARALVGLLVKLDKEFDRLQKIDTK